MGSLSMRGVWAASLTPVDPQGMIDVDRWSAHARWLLDNGCHGIAVFGTTGETQAFSVAERKTALETLIARDVPANRIMVGIGCCARADTVTLAKHALELQVTRQLALPPFFYKGVSDEGLYRAFAETIEAVADPALELFLYHFPQVSQVPITLGLLDRLVSTFPETVQGVKDSSGDLQHTRALVQAHPQLAVFAGNDSHLLSLVEAGGAGTISAAANIACAQSRAVFDAIMSEDGLAAGVGMAVVNAVRETLQHFPMIPAIKHVVARGRNDPAWARVRPPLVELDAAAGDELMAGIEAAGLAYAPGSHPTARHAA